jgi:hypothetical protein
MLAPLVPSPTKFALKAERALGHENGLLVGRLREL